MYTLVCFRLSQQFLGQNLKLTIISITDTCSVNLTRYKISHKLIHSFQWITSLFFKFCTNLSDVAMICIQSTLAQSGGNIFSIWFNVLKHLLAQKHLLPLPCSQNIKRSVLFCLVRVSEWCHYINIDEVLAEIKRFWITN